MLFLASNPIIDAYHQSDLFGKAIFCALFALSVVTWVIFLQKWLKQKEIRKKADQINLLVRKRRINPLSQDFPFPHASHPFGEIYTALKRHTLEILSKNRQVLAENERVFLSRSDIELLEANLSSTITQEVRSMEKNLFLLSTIASLAPFLGLLGTVWGILVTFAHLQSGSLGGQAHGMVMDGLAMALGTTVVGLLVAIPALLAYNYLRASLAERTLDLEDFSQLLVASIELHYRKVDVRE